MPCSRSTDSPGVSYETHMSRIFYRNEPMQHKQGASMTSEMKSQVWTAIDFERHGVQIDYARVPFPPIHRPMAGFLCPWSASMVALAPRFCSRQARMAMNMRGRSPCAELPPHCAIRRSGAASSSCLNSTAPPSLQAAEIRHSIPAISTGCFQAPQMAGRQV